MLRAGMTVASALSTSRATAAARWSSAALSGGACCRCPAAARGQPRPWHAAAARPYGRTPLRSPRARTAPRSGAAAGGAPEHGAAGGRAPSVSHSAPARAMRRAARLHADPFIAFRRGGLHILRSRALRGCVLARPGRPLRDALPRGHRRPPAGAQRPVVAFMLPHLLPSPPSRARSAENSRAARRRVARVVARGGAPGASWSSRAGRRATPSRRRGRGSPPRRSTPRRRCARAPGRTPRRWR